MMKFYSLFGKNYTTSVQVGGVDTRITFDNASGNRLGRGQYICLDKSIAEALLKDKRYGERWYTNEKIDDIWTPKPIHKLDTNEPDKGSIVANEAENNSDEQVIADNSNSNETSNEEDYQSENTSTEDIEIVKVQFSNFQEGKDYLSGKGIDVYGIRSSASLVELAKEHKIEITFLK